MDVTIRRPRSGEHELLVTLPRRQQWVEVPGERHVCVLGKGGVVWGGVGWCRTLIREGCISSVIASFSTTIFPAGEGHSAGDKRDFPKEDSLVPPLFCIQM